MTPTITEETTREDIAARQSKQDQNQQDRENLIKAKQQNEILEQGIIATKLPRRKKNERSPRPAENEVNDIS